MRRKRWRSAKKIWAAASKNLEGKKDVHEQLKTLVKKNSDSVGALSTQLDEANAQVKALQESDDALAKLRKEAQASYEKGGKDRGIALKVLKQARSILKKTFASLLQVQAAASASTSAEDHVRISTSEAASSAAAASEDSGENLSAVGGGAKKLKLKLSFLQVALNKK